MSRWMGLGSLYKGKLSAVWMGFDGKEVAEESADIDPGEVSELPVSVRHLRDTY